ncbi:helix-turn-helix transcriptional regulator [Kineobactrum salinum]|uniref:Helix-turn-helix transcriptional regulator n=1 Tax=Kineobactrum salinum TaxID=2708301 RepID=A0A6C0U008_9GAMM|nr:helix-turn-helix transcriptional regulator [Kineobactrum salinum]QIB65432.1 helix-turn-helix transcriptional regulator [Kineobactrum salinum]
MTPKNDLGTSATISSIINCDGLPAMAETVLRPVARLLQADSAVYLRFRHDSLGQPQICESSYAGQRPDSVGQYMSGYFVEDPILRPVIERPQDWRQFKGPLKFHLRAQVRQSELRSSDYYRKFLQPNDLGDVIGLVFPVDNGGPQMLCVGIHRSSQQPRFTELQDLALDAISGSLRLVLQNLCLRTSVAEQSALINALDATTTGVEFAVFDRQLRMLRASRRLRALFQQTAAGAGGRLRSVAAGLLSRSDDDPVTHAAIELDDRFSGELRLVRDDGEAHFVLIVPEDNRAAPAPPTLGEVLRGRHDLTPRECDVVEQVAKGFSNAGTASALGISIRTVENHLRAVYDKLGVNSRTQLISRIYAN